MTEIKLPKEMLQKDAYKTLPAKEKEEYINNFLKQLLELNSEGVTTSQVKEVTGFPPSTIWHHLEILKSNGQSRKISHGNVDVYHSFGKPIAVADFDNDKARYSVLKVENNEGKFILIQEKRINRQDSYTNIRGVAIPIELVDSIVKSLSKAKESFKK